jgi:chloramphenicol-sensitive protein RarD
VSERAGGLLYLLAAYVSWGVFPVYFKALGGVPPAEVLAHRIVWSAALLTAAVALLGRWPLVRHAYRSGGRLLLLASTVLIAANWLTYIWAVQAGRVMEASLGYFTNPLLSVLLGVLFLRERLRRLQVVAIALAGLGVLALVVQQGTLPWLPLTLALSFGLYGLVRKQNGLDGIGGLLAETSLLVVPALALLLLGAGDGSGAFGASTGTTLLLLAAGPVTALPLVWFAEGVKRLPLSTVGLLQYVAPTLQFACAVALYGEVFTRDHAVAFGCIWTSLAVYSVDALQAARRTEAARASS